MALNIFHDFDLIRPTQLLDQHFGLGLHPEDLMAPLTIPHVRHLPRHPRYYRPWRLQTRDHGSTIENDKNHFQVNLDVQQFSPEELKVKVVDNSLIIEGNHEEKEDEHGYISRQFQRRYVLPEGHDMQHAMTKLSSDGVLSVSIPKINQNEPKEKCIPIMPTGKPHKAIKPAETKEAEKQK